MLSSGEFTVGIPFSGMKLVVWDLDGTLWQGTLDDGDELVPTGLAAWIPALADAGIISSVCSTNDPDAAARALAALGLRELLVSPRIAWGPKSSVISGLLADLNVRPADVLFVDDVARVRDEVSMLCGVRSIDPADLPRFTPGALPLIDPERIRLAQYATLARRLDSRSSVIGREGLESFLRASGIRVAITSVGDQADRVAELTRRANQRNLTGSRLTVDDVESLAADPELTTGCVWMRDRFGDSGLVGFFAVHEPSSTARHLVFSCRSMNLGLEEWVVALAKLRDPAIDIKLNPAWKGVVDWIDLDVEGRSEAIDTQVERDLLWVGGCDLQAVEAYIDPDLAARSRWQVLENRGHVQQYGHSSLLVLDLIARGETGLLGRIPWLANWSPETAETHRAMVLSLWVDYACLTMRHRATGIRLPTYLHLGTSSSPYDWEHWWGEFAGRGWFLDDFVPAPALTPQEIGRLLVGLIDRLATRPVILVNGPDFDYHREYSDGANQSRRNREINSVVDAVVRANPAARLADVRTFVTGPEDLDSPDASLIFHYDRRGFHSLAAAITSELRSGLAEEPHP